MRNVTTAFKNFVTRQLGTNWKEQLLTGFNSKHRLTKVINNPQLALNGELTFIAQCLNVTPWKLIEEYELGKNTLSEYEMQNHQEYKALKEAVKA
ncbi:MAG: hypothetical protein AAFO07_07310 [Bacteroidota bacterium]